LIVLVTFTVGMVFWVTAWAFGVKGFDAFLVPFLLTFLAAGVRLAQPHVERLLKGSHATPGR
jgi:hypothetical protein